jgi:hypothetical protein
MYSHEIERRRSAEAAMATPPAALADGIGVRGNHSRDALTASKAAPLTVRTS